jgi:hypothetical protein
MHRPETKIGKGVKILCNEPNQEISGMKTNA